VGSVLERTVEGDQARYLLRVEQAYKGEISSRVEVVTPVDGAACGLAAVEGDRLGLLLERSGGEWRSGLCSQVDPADFLALSNVEDNQLPAINWGGYVVGFAVLALAGLLLWRRRRRYSGLR
jgi:LPXTG-motif cell wall-anchored protein